MTMQETITFRPPAAYLMTGPAVDLPAVSHQLPGICIKGPPDDQAARVRDRVMTAADMKALVRKTSRYCVHHGPTRAILTGTKLLQALSWMEPASPTQCDFVHTTPRSVKQRNQDLWFRHIDPATGMVAVDSDDNSISIWHTDEMNEPAVILDNPKGMRDHIQNEEYRTAIGIELKLHIAAALHAALKHFQGRKLGLKPATEAGVRAARAAIHAIHAQNLGIGTTPDRFENAYERAYHRTRIEMAGVDLGQHPRLHDYQIFYDLGWAPPTRQEMADHIIKTLGN